MTIPESPRETWDRRSQIDVAERLSRIEDILGSVDTQAKLTNGRLSRAETELSSQRLMLYGSTTDLHGDGGVVGMLRQLRKGQTVTIGLLTAVAIPAALTVLATYLPALL